MPRIAQHTDTHTHTMPKRAMQWLRVCERETACLATLAPHTITTNTFGTDTYLYMPLSMPNTIRLVAELIGREVHIHVARFVARDATK